MCNQLKMTLITKIFIAVFFLISNYVPKCKNLAAENTFNEVNKVAFDLSKFFSLAVLMYFLHIMRIYLHTHVHAYIQMRIQLATVGVAFQNI